MGIIGYPFDSGEILKRKKAYRRQLIEGTSLIEKRIAILSGSTIGDVKDVLELFLLDFGIKPVFYIGQYDRFYEDVMFDTGGLADFNPEVIYLHTTARNLADGALMGKLQEVWSKIAANYSCPIIQNNFELPHYGLDYDSCDINRINIKITDYAGQNRDFYINDIQYLSAQFGLDEWFDDQAYFLYKYAFAICAIPTLCYNLAKVIKSIYGNNQKCLVLDLDNTIWGGVAGDVGVSGIELGMESALGEAYLAFQKYALKLHSRGVFLAICSKNDERIAKEAFGHPNMALRLEDISVFCANWDDKARNILMIAERLNILPSSIVFVDDNPAERDLVRQALPEVKVPEVNSVVDFVRIIEGAGYFYATSTTEDDEKRNEFFTADTKRNEAKGAFLDYGDYLLSLSMSSTIKPFDLPHIDRVTQLINKTNQFNLTTRRYTQSEIEKITSDPNFITLYATLDDKFGSNGITSVLIGEIVERDLHIRLWVMSCRVFKRELELALFDQLVEICKDKGMQKIIGYYFRTEKNGFVANLFDELGFSKFADETWSYDLSDDYQQKNKSIAIRKVDE